MNTLYAVCWNNEDTGKVVITAIRATEKAANDYKDYLNHHINVYYVVQCCDIDLRK